MKAPHHGSKHGVNLELIERISPRLTLVSSVAKGGSYGFPHGIAQELMREALRPTMNRGGKRHKDYEVRDLLHERRRRQGDAPPHDRPDEGPRPKGLIR
ncbi:MAG: hypothetical protein ACRDKW_10765 [Actinomycetota bacterium]